VQHQHANHQIHVNGARATAAEGAYNENARRLILVSWNGQLDCPLDRAYKRCIQLIARDRRERGGVVQLMGLGEQYDGCTGVAGVISKC
jgi:hypothetical protein